MPEQSQSPERLPRRQGRELKTIRAMVDIFCRENHTSPERPCADCRELLAYAEKRLRLCPFQAGKPTCGKCTVHCYKKDMREQVRAVMRYSGPRMIRHHPLLALRHLIDGLRKAPAPRTRRRIGNTAPK